MNGVIKLKDKLYTQGRLLYRMCYYNDGILRKAMYYEWNDARSPFGSECYKDGIITPICDNEEPYYDIVDSYLEDLE